MDCCEKLTPEFTGEPENSGNNKIIGRRSALKRLAGLAGGIMFVSKKNAYGQGRQVLLAFCGQLLCVIPYEVTRARGHVADEGLDVRLVCTRGGNVAMQALVGGSVDYAGTSFDVALQAFAHGAKISRFASTGRLPLFALASAPKTAKEIRGLKDLENRTVGVSALGNADHILVLYLMKRAGADPNRVRFATIGTNLLDALRLGQVDAGMVQEPALTLITGAGGGVIANAMDIEQANRYLGGAYEFMGVAVRVEERERRRDEPGRRCAQSGGSIGAIDRLQALTRSFNRWKLSAARPRSRSGLWRRTRHRRSQSRSRPWQVRESRRPLGLRQN